MNPEWRQFFPAMILTLIRVSSLMVFAPVFSSQAIPNRVKAVFALVVSALLAPVVASFPMANAEIGITSVLGELGVGMLYGISLALLNEVLLFAGLIVGIQFSFSLVNLLDPNSQIQTPLLGEVFTLYGTMVLLASGLHRTLLASVMRCFHEAPVGSVFLDTRACTALVCMASGIFLSALQLAAPVLAATLLVELTIALLARLSPQLPALALTVPAKTMLGSVVLIGSLSLWPRFIEARFSGLLDSAQMLVRHCTVGS